MYTDQYKSITLKILAVIVLCIMRATLKPYFCYKHHLS